MPKQHGKDKPIVMSALVFRAYAESCPQLAYKYQPVRFWKYMKKNYPGITKKKLKEIIESLKC